MIVDGFQEQMETNHSVLEHFTSESDYTIN